MQVEETIVATPFPALTGFEQLYVTIPEYPILSQLVVLLVPYSKLVFAIIPKFSPRSHVTFAQGFKVSKSPFLLLPPEHEYLGGRSSKA